MSEQVFRNHGQLFEEQGLSEIGNTAEWGASRIDEVRHALLELNNRREQLFEEMEEGKQLSELETQYHWVSAVFRYLGFTFSIAEQPPGGDESARPDFTLFYNGDDFRNALNHRGEREFFSQALGVVRCLPWDASLDEYESSHEGPNNPAYDIDRIIRSTGVNWGILTNGQEWRLYHRETSGLFSTYFQVNLMEALLSGDLNQFKYFWTIFSPEGLGGFESQEPLVHRLLH
ncbi:hypothetical protein FRD01_07150 [Microvenator marinus]|jgi:hypothetical protein|uniref:Restriction endonuclease n=1 Tax=Microvenator marinus TaxID=2600177 RepID=A0A5B8XN19_9DELT|nr:hypothetical protein [Microvenator marinus]QED27020.1 hypothetical protein FRD01_07150 [Microvenator marinus]